MVIVNGPDPDRDDRAEINAATTADGDLWLKERGRPRNWISSNVAVNTEDWR